MNKPIVACIQHRLIVPKTADEYDAHLHRFLRMAKAKGAVLALFPELSGVATAFPLLSGWRNSLLIEADQGRRKQAGFWQRTKSKMAGGAANVVRADLRKSLIEALQIMPESLHDAYFGGFSNLARQYEMTIVAGSLYEYDADTQSVQNVATVYGPDGEVLGKQAKVVLATRDRELSEGSDGWGVIPTPAGRVGILLGNDVLYPEPARILAYQGADMLLAMGAVTKPATYHKIRQAAQARCQENQLYGMVSFLTGPDPFAPADAPPFVGKSAIFAPIDFTHRFSGVMVEVGSPLAEGVITAEWDYPALEELWQESDTPLRREMPLLQAGPILANVYGRALPLADAEQLMLEAAGGGGEDEDLGEPELLLGAEEMAEMLEEIEPEAADEPPLPSISAIWPDSTQMASPEELDQAAEAMSGKVEIQSRNVDAAADEVRDAIAQASEQVRSTVVDAPDAVEDEIAQAVEAARLALDDEAIGVDSGSVPAVVLDDEEIVEPTVAIMEDAEPAFEFEDEELVEPVVSATGITAKEKVSAPVWEPEPDPEPEPSPRRWPWQRG